MPLDKNAFDEAIEIQKEFERQFAGVDEVVGIGIGLNKAADAPAISVQVATEAAADKLPSSFQGLDVILDIVGEFKAH
ncbi:MAG: hypothetical protein KL863_22910 [Rhizobium sp.]|nr:hypothetical protein [Rhizobium sp.]